LRKKPDITKFAIFTFVAIATESLAELILRVAKLRNGKKRKGQFITKPGSKKALT